MSILKSGDMFVVQADPSGIGKGKGEVGFYTGADFQSDVRELVSDTNVKVWIQHDPPPTHDPNDSLSAGESDLWFDNSVHTMFVMTRTKADPITQEKGYIWVIVDPSDRAKLGTNDSIAVVEFPYMPSHGDKFDHPLTGVEYYYHGTRNQWYDVYTPASDSIKANRDSIEILDDKVEERVKIAGDTMTGNLIMGGSTYISTTGLQDVNQFTPAYNMELIGDSVEKYSKIDIVRPRPAVGSYDFGLKIDLNEESANNNLIIQGSDTILSINGNSGNTGVQFHKRINGTSLELQNDGGIIVKGSVANNNFLRTYFPEASGNNRTSALFFDDSEEITKFQVDNYPLKFTCTDGTITSGDDKVDLIKLAVSNTDTTELGSYCSIQRLVEPTLDSDAATKKYVDDKSASVVEQHNSNTPPGSRARGTLLMTDNNQLYIYTG